MNDRQGYHCQWNSWGLAFGSKPVLDHGFRRDHDDEMLEPPLTLTLPQAWKKFEKDLAKQR